MKTKKIKETVAKSLANILLSLSIKKPSGKTKTYMDEITKKLTKRLKSDSKKILKKKSEKKTPKVVRASTKALSKRRSRGVRAKQ